MSTGWNVGERTGVDPPRALSLSLSPPRLAFCGCRNFRDIIFNHASILATRCTPGRRFNIPAMRLCIVMRRKRRRRSCEREMLRLKTPSVGKLFNYLRYYGGVGARKFDGNAKRRKRGEELKGLKECWRKLLVAKPILIYAAGELEFVNFHESSPRLPR